MAENHAFTLSQNKILRPRNPRPTKISHEPGVNGVTSAKTPMIIKKTPSIFLTYFLYLFGGVCLKKLEPILRRTLINHLLSKNQCSKNKTYYEPKYNKLGPCFSRIFFCSNNIFSVFLLAIFSSII